MSLLDFLGRRPAHIRFPSIAAMERAGRRRLPKFAWDFMAGGIGREVGKARNLSDLDTVTFTPRYVVDYDYPADLSSTLFGKWSAPFGPGPVGLQDLVWPGAQAHVLRAAADHNLPAGFSVYATASIEEAAGIVGPNLWFQQYPMAETDIEQDLLGRYRSVGGDVLIVTMDVPHGTRRERDIGNGLSIPPRQDLLTYWQAAIRPSWSVATLRNGMPRFKTVERYIPPDTPPQSSMQLLGSLAAGHVGPERLRQYRDQWNGKLVIKGVLHQEDLKHCLDAGVDGIVVSNHGGRQLDGAVTAPEVLPSLRQYAGGKLSIIADGGVRSGLDIARMLALGADHVFLGRALAFAVAAAGAEGPALAMDILKQEMVDVLSQLGCQDYRDLTKYLTD
ncbi:MAG: alpha-hydroxy acid oxidase [Pseudomonadota bacterium]